MSDEEMMKSLAVPRTLRSEQRNGEFRQFYRCLSRIVATIFIPLSRRRPERLMNASATDAFIAMSSYERCGAVI